jgi:hypothetical protein
MSCSRANKGSWSRDPTEGELTRPRSPANGTEPYLAHPRKRFHGRISGPRAYPYRTGHGRPLELPDNSSKRNLRFATRSMGVADTSPPRPAEGRQGDVWKSRRVRPDRLEWAQARGLDARLHLLDMHRMHANVDTRIRRHRSWLKYCRCRLR